MATEIVQPMDDRVDGVPPTDAPTSIVPPMEGPPSELRPGSGEEEGVEVVMDSHGKSAVVDRPDQNVFRAPHPVRPRAMRVPPHVKSSESYGYPPHGAPSGEYGHRPYPVPYANSGSFDEGGYQQHPPASHYSPHVQYPPPSGRHPEDVNVISPSHSTHKGGHRPPGTPSRHYGGRYQYPPTSPVSRPMGTSASPPRNRGYMRRPEGPYSAATRGRGQSEDGSWNHYDYSRPPLVTESSFDSDHYSSHASHSHPTTPNAPHYGPPPPPTPSHRDPHYRQGSFYNSSFGGSFDSHAPQPPPPHFDDYRYYGHSPHHAPESPYSPSYSHGGYSQSGYYDQYSPYPEYGHHPRGPYDDKRYGDYPHAITPNKKDANTGMLLPKAAQEIDFEVTDPPMEPTTPPSKTPLCESPADVNSYDVLCGRGGGTNSQIGNRRFRQLVQEFQPIYLLARRKEKPLLARTIVLIIRKRGGRFLKKDDETGELFEVGDAKAEAKTSQALREGLDVRATKNAASTILDKKKKKKGKNGGVTEESEDETKPEEASPEANRKATEHPTPSTPQSPPVLPRLNGDEKPPAARPPSPEHMQFRKRRRMRSADAADQTEAGCVTGFQDKFFSDFCPPRADLGRVASPPNVPAAHYQNHHHHHHPHHNHPHHSSAHPMDMDMATTPTRSNSRHYDDDDDDIRAENAAQQQAARGCAGIAMDMVTGAATGSFCLGPRNWR